MSKTNKYEKVYQNPKAIKSLKILKIIERELTFNYNAKKIKKKQKTKSTDFHSR